MGGALHPLTAQLPHLTSPGSAWIDVNYPKLFWTPREGVTGGAYLGVIRALSLENADHPAPYEAAVSADGQLSTSGSRQLTLEARAPALVPGWRFVLTLEGARRARENYFGLGNQSVYDKGIADVLPRFYQARATRWIARGEVQRILAGPLRALAGFDAEHWRFDPLGAGALALDAASGADPTIGTGTGDVSGRVGLVFDTRNDEVEADRGVLLQAIQGAGRVAGGSYSRSTVSAAGYQPVGENLVLAARVVGQGMGGSPRLGTYYLVESSDRPYFGLGGALSHRGLPDNRFLGRDKLLLNVDARYHVVNLPRTARLTVFGFFDAGRVFQNESFSITTSDLKLGGGGGLFFQLARAGIAGFTLGFGPDGPVLDFATRWTY